MWVYIYHMHADAHRGQKELLDPLKLELQEVGSNLRWVLGTEPRPSERGVSTPNSRVISVALMHFNLELIQRLSCICDYILSTYHTVGHEWTFIYGLNTFRFLMH